MVDAPVDAPVDAARSRLARIATAVTDGLSRTGGADDRYQEANAVQSPKPAPRGPADATPGASAHHKG
jgi:hypothetical protein